MTETTTKTIDINLANTNDAAPRKAKNKTQDDLERYALAIERLNEALDELPHHRSDKLARAVEWVSRMLERQQISLDAEGKVTGLRPEFVQVCFADFCERARRRELSRRQRSAYVAAFNQIAEQLQPRVSVAIAPVKNYMRAPRPLPVQVRYLARLPVSIHGKLMKVLLDDVFGKTIASPEQWFLRVVLLMVMRLGVTFKGCFQSLCLVRVEDIYPDHVIVPRDTARRRWLRVWLDDVTAIAWRALYIARARLPADGRRRKRTVQTLPPLLFLAHGALDAANKRQLRALRERLQEYLNELCERAGIEALTLTQVIQLTRAALTFRAVYPGDVIAMLSGHINTSVMPPGRIDADWQSTPELPVWQGAIPTSKGHIMLEPTAITQSTKRIRWDERLLVEQHIKVHQIQDTLRGKEDVPGARREIIAASQRLLRSWLWLNLDDDIGAALATFVKTDRVIECNLAYLAAWVADLIGQGKRLQSIRTYLSDLKAILATFPYEPLWDLGDAEREQIAEFDALTQSPTQRLSAWRSLRLFLQSQGLSLAPLSAKNPRCERYTVAEDVFTPTDVVALMKVLNEIDTLEAHEAFVATPLAFYAMLRIDEVLNIRICQLILAGDAPYIDVRNAKGGQSRRVYLVEVPDAILGQLREMRNARVNALRRQNSQIGNEASFRQPLLDLSVVDASSLEKVFHKAARMIGRSSCTFHDLRKGGANWRYMRGDDVRLISLGLGHGACGVTYLSYLRTVDLRQRAAAQKMACDASLSRAKLAALLSIEDSSYVAKLVRACRDDGGTNISGVTLQLAKQLLRTVAS